VPKDPRLTQKFIAPSRWALSQTEGNHSKTATGVSNDVDARLLLKAGIKPTIFNRHRAREVADADLILSAVPLDVLAEQLSDERSSQVAARYGVTRGQLLLWMQGTTERQNMLSKASNSQSITLVEDAITEAELVDQDNYKANKAKADILLRASAALKPKEQDVDTATTIVWAMPELGSRQAPSLPDDLTSSSSGPASLEAEFERVPPSTGD